MANILPFRGVLYDPTAVKDVAKVVAPPYDVIDPNYQKALYARHPNNIIRLELGLDQPDDGPLQNRYTRAAAWLQDWMNGGVLRRDAHPSIYFYAVDYRPPLDTSTDGMRTLKGFLASVELEEFGTGRIFPHENTRSAAKEDRLKLLEHCRANFSPIFSLFSDPEGSVLELLEKSIDQDRPRLDFQDDSGSRQRLWAITDPAVLREATAAMRSKPLFIADGHHRYETALTYRRLRRQQAGLDLDGSNQPLQPYDSVLMLFSSLEDPGLTVLPTHRVLTAPLPPADDVTRLLGDAFDIESFVFQPQPETETEVRRRFLRALRVTGQIRPAFGLSLRGTNCYFLLALRDTHRPESQASERDKLDVAILQNQVLNRLCSAADQEAIVYTKDDHEALQLVLDGNAHAALLLNPTKVSEVRAVAASGERMPHKSTYFFPKPLTGLVINVMDE